MTVVFPPCIIDFAKAYVDNPPEFTPEVLQDWHDDSADLFGNDWESVEKLLDALDDIGIHYYDAKPGNIWFSS